MCGLVVPADALSPGSYEQEYHDVGVGFRTPLVAEAEVTDGSSQACSLPCTSRA